MTSMNRIRINMIRSNALRNIAGTSDSLAWGKSLWQHAMNTHKVVSGMSGNVHALAFSALLIACSLTVGCSSSTNSEKPKTVSSDNQIPVTQLQTATAPVPTPIMQAENKPAPKKAVHKKPATVNYTDKTYGVTFEYPRRYAIETGDAAAELLLSNPVAMNFVQPGGVALAAVELPETSFVNTDFSSAFFDVTVHKSLTADQCTEFASPQPKSTGMPAPTPAETSAATPANASAVEKPEAGSISEPVSSTQAQTTPTAASETAKTAPAEGSQEAQSGSKLLLGDMELRATEAVSGEGTRQSDSKYFHVYQNGACYEFGLNVTTVASQDGLIKHVDRDKVFERLEKILATVKINTVAPDANAEIPASAPAPTAPAQ